jgi:hypothetical protein
MVGGEWLHAPTPLQPPLETKVTLRVEPAVTQTKPVAADSVAATCPEEHEDGSGVVGTGPGADPPLATVRLTTVPDATDCPDEGLVATTLPVEDPGEGIPAITPTVRPAWVRERVAAP